MQRHHNTHCTCPNTSIDAEALVRELNTRTTQLKMGGAYPLIEKTDSSGCLELSKRLAQNHAAIRRARRQRVLAVRAMERAMRAFGEIMRRETDLQIGATGLISVLAIMQRDPISLMQAIDQFETWRREYIRKLPERVKQFLLPQKIAVDSAQGRLVDELRNDDALRKRMVKMGCDVGFFAVP